MGLTVNSSECRRHLANGILIAGFFPLDLGFFGLVWVSLKQIWVYFAKSQWQQ